MDSRFRGNEIKKVSFAPFVFKKLGRIAIAVDSSPKTSAQIRAWRCIAAVHFAPLCALAPLREAISVAASPRPVVSVFSCSRCLFQSMKICAISGYRPSDPLREAIFFFPVAAVTRYAFAPPILVTAVRRFEPEEKKREAATWPPPFSLSPAASRLVLISFNDYLRDFRGSIVRRIDVIRNHDLGFP